ncbi:MAG: pyruvate kinase [Alphaproteobacteria bacterium]
MRRYRNAKIIATLGPASGNPATIKALFEAGADVFRLNMSHGTHDDHRANYATVRALEATTGRPIGTLFDLQGPKLRVGRFAGDKATLENGTPFRLDLDDSLGDATRAYMPHPEVFRALEKDTEILIDDGRIRLRVESCGPDSAETEVVVGGVISNNKGFNLPNVILPLSPLTRKDHQDLRFALDMGCDWIALSFVQLPEDVAEARKLIGNRARVMSKLEKPSAIEHLEQIIEMSDAVMVARGDLGVEMPPETVPGVQKQIIRSSRHTGKPVVVATQMLESMISAPQPTRAEASDVATAVYDGADCVMLSGETAAGKFPVEAVEMMDRIITQVERDPLYRGIIERAQLDPDATAADAITAAARQVAETIRAAAVVTYTTSGSTALRAARERPPVSILCLTPSQATARQLAPAWGIHAVVTPDATNLDDMVEIAERLAKDQGFAKSGDRLVITAGVPFGTPGATNLLRIAWVE